MRRVNPGLQSARGTGPRTSQQDADSFSEEEEEKKIWSHAGAKYRQRFM